MSAKTQRFKIKLETGITLPVVIKQDSEISPSIVVGRAILSVENQPQLIDGLPLNPDQFVLARRFIRVNQQVIEHFCLGKTDRLDGLITKLSVLKNKQYALDY